jgi:hypothetical protein
MLNLFENLLVGVLCSNRSPAGVEIGQAVSAP